MKKLMAVLLAVGCLLGTTTFASAAAYFELDEDRFPELFTPGVLYKFAVTDGQDPITESYFKDFSLTIKIDEGSRYVDRLRFVEQENGEYMLEFLASDGYTYLEPQDIEFTITATDREDEDYTDYENYTWTVGYSWGGAEYVHDTTYEVDFENPFVEFDEQIFDPDEGQGELCKLYFGDLARYTAAPRFDRTYNLYYTTRANEEVVNANPDAQLQFLSFPGGAIFDEENWLVINVRSGMNYLYEIKGGKVSKVAEGAENGALAVKTDRLGYYVASDIPLNGELYSSIVANDPDRVECLYRKGVYNCTHALCNQARGNTAATTASEKVEEYISRNECLYRKGVYNCNHVLCNQDR